MKKILMIAALASSLSIAPQPIQAMEEKNEKVGWLKKQFNATVDRFKRCMHGECTRMEALKVARDVGVAAAAVIAAIYTGKHLIGKAEQGIIPAEQGIIPPALPESSEKGALQVFPVGSIVSFRNEWKPTEVIQGTVIGAFVNRRGTYLKVQVPDEADYRPIFYTSIRRIISSPK